MRVILFFVILFAVGCASGPGRYHYQSLMKEQVESPFFYIPPLNQKDYEERAWILLAESRQKIWYYDPYTLKEDADGILTFDAFFSPREINQLALYNATIVGPYRQKIDCFGNYQWSETLYTQNIISQQPLVGDTKPVSGTGWVKIAPRTAMAYIRTRLCGRKFIDNQDINYFLYQDRPLPAPISQKAPIEIYDEKQNLIEGPNNAKPPVFYEVINNEVRIVNPKKDIRQIRLSSYTLGKDLLKQADYIFTANCQENSYAFASQGQAEKLSSELEDKTSLSAVAFDRACGNHGVYMKISN
jgi:hypothetical protein